MPIRCRQGKCLATFSTVFNFLRHVNVYHCGDVHDDFQFNCANIVSRPANDSESGCVCDEVPPIYRGADDLNYVECLDDVRTEAVSLVAGLRANSSVPYSVIPNVVESFNHMATSLTRFASQVVQNCIDEIDSVIDQSVKMTLM